MQTDIHKHIKSPIEVMFADVYQLSATAVIESWPLRNCSSLETGICVMSALLFLINHSHQHVIVTEGTTVIIITDNTFITISWGASNLLLTP